MTSRIQHCSHFGRCGGCSRLDVPIEQQLADKRQQLRSLLEPWLDDVDISIHEPPRPPRHDRTAILYPVQPRGRTKVAGIYRVGTHDVEVIEDCRIQHKALTEFGRRAHRVLGDSKVPAYDEATGEGVLRAIRARIMPGTNELIVGAVATTSKFPHRDALLVELERAAQGLRDDQGRPVRLVGVVCNINDRPGNVLLGDDNRIWMGKAFQFDRVGELRLRVGFSSFYQLHRHAEAILFRPALQMLGDVNGLHVVDAYGGVGTFALRLLRDGAGRVDLIESSAGACDDARYNFDKNGFAERTAVHLRAFAGTPPPDCDLLIADPPRAGLMAEGAETLLQNAPPRVLLVSCRMDSLARDLELLTARYRIEAVRLCDLFPHTEHAEVLTLLTRR